MKLILKCIYLLADWVLLNRLSFAPRPTRPYWYQYSDRDDKCMPLLLLVFCFFFFPNSTSSCLPWIHIHTYVRRGAVRYIHKCKHEAAHDEIRTLSPPLFIRKPRVRTCYVVVVAFYVKFLLKTQSRLLYYIFTRASDISTFATHVFVCVCVCVCVYECGGLHVCAASKCFVLLRDRVR